MQFEDVNEQTGWEARRIAAAFGVNIATVRAVDRPAFKGYSADTGRERIEWSDGETFITIRIFSRDPQDLVCCLRRHPHQPRWIFFFESFYGEMLASALYRLGFEDTAVLKQLPSLTTHQKLELRLSLPREFWPLQWQKET